MGLISVSEGRSCLFKAGGLGPFGCEVPVQAEFLYSIVQNAIVDYKPKLRTDSI